MVLHCLSAPSPDGYGWTIEATNLDIKSGPMERAPDSILEIICNVQVQESCNTKRCPCKKAARPDFGGNSGGGGKKLGGAAAG